MEVQYRGYLNLMNNYLLVKYEKKKRLKGEFICLGCKHLKFLCSCANPRLVPAELIYIDESEKVKKGIFELMEEKYKEKQ